MRDHARISVIIPAFNEAEAIGKVISAVPDWVDEVLVVDNGSTDKTVEVAVAHGARVVTQPERGYGAACLAGIRNVDDPDVIVFLDGDFSDHPEEMDRLVDPIVTGKVDLVIGSRVLGRRERGALTPQARFGNWLACKLIRLFWGVRHTDLGPFRAVRNESLQKLRMRDRDFGWTVEMQVKAAAGGLRVREAPVSYRCRIGRSKISGTVRGVVLAGVKILGTIFVQALRRRGQRNGGSGRRRLVIFTRYPEPGKTKTRLIPKLGERGAADLQRAMTRHTLGWADQLRRDVAVDVEVRFEGGTRTGMAECFGPGFCYVPQGEGDLGERMARAFDHAFREGLDSVVIIGADCPDLTAARLGEAFAALRDNKLVLGPATDGGYTLIGLSESLPKLFAGPAWGTETVLEQTKEIARGLGVQPTVLDPLEDVDLPEDLEAWKRASAKRPASMPVGRISVIIPTLNEATMLPRTLEELPTSSNVEVIVVDGGSRDDTVSVARSFGVTVVETQPDRAAQMNIGARQASGDALLFLHADTVLPAGGLEGVREALIDPRCVGGAFAARVDSARRSLAIMTWGINRRTRWLRLPYGDQGIFVRTDVFRRLGGYRPLPIMEDVDLVRRLRSQGRLAVVPDRILISDRRWFANGPLRTMFVNWMGITLYSLGVSPSRVRRLYDGLLESGNSSRVTDEGIETGQHAGRAVREENIEEVKTRGNDPVRTG